LHRRFPIDVHPDYGARVVQGVATLEDYVSRPIGRYLWGPTYVVWFSSSSSFSGIMFWGRPEEEHIRRIVSAVDGELRWPVPPHVSLIDVRRISAVDLAAFTTLLQYVQARREPLARMLTRQAILRPDGLAGAAVAGFPAVLGRSHPLKVFTDPMAALRWLGAEREIGIVHELDEIHATASGGSAFVAAIRAHLERAPGTLTLKDTARAFGLSPRNLQRKLGEVHTTFQFEQHAARVRRAKTLLLETNYDLKRIAIELGCASLQNFSALFHKSTGESPSQWRSHQRPGDFPARPVPRSQAPQRRDPIQTL
jgi:AraC-like DNA-binding protein